MKSENENDQHLAMRHHILKSQKFGPSHFALTLSAPGSAAPAIVWPWRLGVPPPGQVASANWRDAGSVPNQLRQSPRH